MNEITFIIPAPPIGKQRPRTFTTSKGKVRTITPDKTRNFEKLVAWAYKKQYPNTHFIGELEVVIDAYFEIPKSWSKKKKSQAASGEMRPCVTPDCDNIAKAVLDALNSTAFEDDKSICDLHIHKHYSDFPRVVVKIVGEIVRA